jgi:hypothetical protein
MQSASGFIPVESAHVDQPELCATCHTLYTPYVDATGEIGGVFPEQTAYLEWQASSFGGAITCQDCHMPVADGHVQLSVTGGPPRSPFYQHQFAGGNAYILEVLQAYGSELAVTASSAQLQDKQDQIVAQIETRTASLDLAEITLDGADLTVKVAVASMTGHKFPTGFPSRRAWIHLLVQNANGQVVFESGRPNADGSIDGNDNDLDAASFETHHLVIDEPGQVQIYEAIMANTDGEVTTTLLRGAGYLKDNRLLPSGFDKLAAEADIAVHGVALDDADFSGGRDLVRYAIDVDQAQGPFSVTAELLYQSIGYRWAANLSAYDAPEPARFVAYYDQVYSQPLTVAGDSAQVGD